MEAVMAEVEKEAAMEADATVAATVAVAMEAVLEAEPAVVTVEAAMVVVSADLVVVETVAAMALAFPAVVGLAELMVCLAVAELAELEGTQRGNLQDGTRTHPQTEPAFVAHRPPGCDRCCLSVLSYQHPSQYK